MINIVKIEAGVVTDRFLFEQTEEAPVTVDGDGIHIGKALHTAPKDGEAFRVDDEAQIGWVENGDGGLEKPDLPAPEPSTDPLDYPLNPIQFDAILDFLGFSKDQLEGYIRYIIPAGMEQSAAVSKMRNSPRYRRDHPLFGIVAASIPITDTELDDAWMKAAKIQ